MKNYLGIFLILSVEICHAQVGDIIWEDNFDNLDNWMKITGNGSWGWGNGELEFYQEENVEITDVEISYAFKLILDEFKSLGIYQKLQLESKY